MRADWREDARTCEEGLGRLLALRWQWSRMSGACGAWAALAPPKRKRQTSDVGIGEGDEIPWRGLGRDGGKLAGAGAW